MPQHGALAPHLLSAQAVGTGYRLSSFRVVPVKEGGGEYNNWQ